MHKKLGTSELHFINTIDQCTEQYGKYKQQQLKISNIQKPVNI